MPSVNPIRFYLPLVLVFFLFATSINSSNNFFTNISFTQPVTDPSPLGCQNVPTRIPIMFLGVGSSKNWKCVSNSIFKEGNEMLYHGIFISNVKISGNFNLRVCLLYFVNSIAFNFRFSNKYFL